MCVQNFITTYLERGRIKLNKLECIIENDLFERKTRGMFRYK